MSAHMKKHHISDKHVIRIWHAGVIYQFPKEIAKKYRIDDKVISADDVFVNINKKYTKPGALLRGIRIRENLTQIQMAKEMKVTQSDISQMENGIRNIGRKIAKRIQRLFGVDYRSFLK